MQTQDPRHGNFGFSPAGKPALWTVQDELFSLKWAESKDADM